MLSHITISKISALNVDIKNKLKLKNGNKNFHFHLTDSY